MRKCLAKTITSVAVIAATAAQLSAFSVSAAETGAEAGNFPRISITTKAGNGNELEKADDYVKATIKVVSPADASGDYSVLEETGKIKVRGNSTARAEKKPFNIKLDKKQNVLDMGKGKVFQPIRVACVGRAVSPGIGETLALLGREQTLARMRRARELTS